MTNAITRGERRRKAEMLLIERVGYGEVVRILGTEYGVSPKTIKRDIEAIYKRWREDSKGESAARLDLAIRTAEREITRLRRLLLRPTERMADGSPGGRPPKLSYREHMDLSSTLLKWEAHLAKLQGLIVGRVEVLGTETMTVVCNLPGGPFGRRPDADGG